MLSDGLVLARRFVAHIFASRVGTLVTNGVNLGYNNNCLTRRRRSICFPSSKNGPVKPR